MVEVGAQAEASHTYSLSVAAAGWDSHDERLLAEAEPLFEELRDAGLVVPGVAEPGTKGTAETLEAVLVALGSAGAISALRDIAIEWIKARHSRSIKIISGSTGDELEITGQAPDDPRVWDQLKKWTEE